MEEYNKVQLKPTATTNENTVVEDTKPEEPIALSRESVVANEPIKNEVPKKSLISRAISVVLGTRDVKAIASDIRTKIVEPTIRDLIVNIGMNAINMWAYGATPSRNMNTGVYTGNGGNGQKEDYTGYYKGSPRQAVIANQFIQDVPYVQFYSQQAAEAIVVQLQQYQMMDRNHFVSALKFKDLTGIKANADDDYIGWYNVSGYSIRLDASTGMYLLDMPKPVRRQ